MKASSYRLTFLILLIVFANSNSNSQTFSWAQGLSGMSSIRTIVFDENNNSYSVGMFRGTIDFDPGPAVMNLTAVSTVGGDMFLRKLDPLGNLLWVKHFAGMSPGVYGLYGRSIDLDAWGNIYIAGSVRDSFDVDPDVGVYSLSTNGGLYAFILKLDPDGNFKWVKTIGSNIVINNTAGFEAMQVIGGSIFLGGYFSGMVDADPGAAVYNITSSGSSDLLIVKLDTTGNFIWTRPIGGTGGEHVLSLAVDSLSNLYLTGDFTDTVDFEPGPGVSKLYSGGIFIAKYDSAGNYFWAKKAGHNGNWEKAHGITTDPFGNVLVTGYFGSIVDFDPGLGVYNLTSNSTRSIFTLKLRNNGDFAWARMAGASAGLFAGTAIATDSGGNVYTVARAPGGCDMDPGSAVHNVAGDCIIQKLDSSGNFVWAAGWEGDIPGWIGLDHNNSVYTTGVFSGFSRDFDPGPDTFLLSGNNSGSGFILKLEQTDVSNIAANINLPYEVNVYPNPSRGIITIASFFVINRVEVTDLTGRVVYVAEPDNTQVSIDLCNKAAGVYFYVATCGERKATGKIVVR